MTKSENTTAHDGVWIRRDERTGKFISVKTSHGVFKQSVRSLGTLKEVSSRRKSALKRLADR